MRIDDLPESWTRDPFQHEFPEHPVFDDPGSVRVVDIPDVVRYSDDVPVPIVDDGVRLKQHPADKNHSEAIEGALDAAYAMREAAYDFERWMPYAFPHIASDYDHLIEEAEARIDRLKRLAGQE
jgi:hypothetical protein